MRRRWLPVEPGPVRDQDLGNWLGVGAGVSVRGVCFRA